MAHSTQKSEKKINGRQGKMTENRNTLNVNAIPSRLFTLSSCFLSIQRSSAVIVVE